MMSSAVNRCLNVKFVHKKKKKSFVTSKKQKKNSNKFIAIYNFICCYETKIMSFFHCIISFHNIANDEKVKKGWIIVCGPNSSRNPAALNLKAVISPIVHVIYLSYSCWIFAKSELDEKRYQNLTRMWGLKWKTFHTLATTHPTPPLGA